MLFNKIRLTEQLLVTLNMQCAMCIGLRVRRLILKSRGPPFTTKCTLHYPPPPTLGGRSLPHWLCWGRAARAAVSTPSLMDNRRSGRSHRSVCAFNATLGDPNKVCRRTEAAQKQQRRRGTCPPRRASSAEGHLAGDIRDAVRGSSHAAAIRGTLEGII